MTDGQLSYFVKWKGYSDSENSWVFESDMGGAQEMIREYWDKVPKKNIKKMGAKGGKAGKRQSSLQAGSPDVKSGSGKKRGRRESSLLTGETPLRKSGLRKGLAPSRSPTPPGTLQSTTPPSNASAPTPPSPTRNANSSNRNTSTASNSPDSENATHASPTGTPSYVVSKPSRRCRWQAEGVCAVRQGGQVGV